MAYRWKPNQRERLIFAVVAAAIERGAGLTLADVRAALTTALHVDGLVTADDRTPLTHRQQAQLQADTIECYRLAMRDPMLRRLASQQRPH